MKKLKLQTLFLIASVFLLSCSGADQGEESDESQSTEKTEEEQKMDEINASLKFNVGMASYEQYSKLVLESAYALDNDSEDVLLVLGDSNLELMDGFKEGAEEKFQSVIDDNPITIYTDSAQIYLDSIDYYQDLWRESVTNYN